MITLAQIVSKDISNSKYEINIPILQGRPDSENEVNLFNNQVGIKKLLNPGISDIDARKYVQNQWLNAAKNETSEYPWAFKTNAFVCAFPGSTNLYEVGDWVYVGFIDNSMSMPVILGHAVGLYYSHREKDELQCESKPVLTLSGLKVEALEEGQPTTVELPPSTTFKFSDGDMTAGELQSILTAFKSFGVTVDTTTYTGLAGIKAIVEKLAPLVNHVASILPQNNIANPSNPVQENSSTQGQQS